MNLDLLDETYLMVKSNLHFLIFDHTGLTGGTTGLIGQTRCANFGCKQFSFDFSKFFL
jgi:hypothetical protein